MDDVCNGTGVVTTCAPPGRLHQRIQVTYAIPVHTSVPGKTIPNHPFVWARPRGFCAALLYDASAILGRQRRIHIGTRPGWRWDVWSPFIKTSHLWPGTRAGVRKIKARGRCTPPFAKAGESTNTSVHVLLRSEQFTFACVLLALALHWTHV
eukprot:gene18706-biopygen5440